MREKEGKDYLSNIMTRVFFCREKSMLYIYVLFNTMFRTLILNTIFSIILFYHHNFANKIININNLYLQKPYSEKNI